MSLGISSPNDWTYAKISLSDKNNKIVDVTSATPTKEGKITVYEPGLYWIEAQIRIDGETIEAYETTYVKSSSKNNPFGFLNILDIPERPILIIFAVFVIIALVGLKIRK